MNAVAADDLSPTDEDVAWAKVQAPPKKAVKPAKPAQKVVKGKKAIAQKQSNRSVISTGDGSTKEGRMVSSLADASVKNLPPGHPAHKAFEAPAPEQAEADKKAEAAFIDTAEKKPEYSSAFIDIATGEKLS